MGNKYRRAARKGGVGGSGIGGVSRGFSVQVSFSACVWAAPCLTAWMYRFSEKDCHGVLCNSEYDAVQI
jgi:hypothetical protein